MKSCKQFEEVIFDHVDNLVSGEKRKELDQHLGQCPPCQEMFKNAKEVSIRLHNLNRIKTSSDFETVLRTRITMERSLNRGVFINWPMRLPTYAISGVLVILIAFFVASVMKGELLFTNSKKSPGLPSLISNQPIGNNSVIQNSSPAAEAIHFPMDWKTIRGTAINSTEYERNARARLDSAHTSIPKETIVPVEF